MKTKAQIKLLAMKICLRLSNGLFFYCYGLAQSDTNDSLLMTPLIYLFLPLRLESCQLTKGPILLLLNVADL